jgi:hypothetical protein
LIDGKKRDCQWRIQELWKELASVWLVVSEFDIATGAGVCSWELYVFSEWLLKRQLIPAIGSKRMCMLPCIGGKGVGSIKEDKRALRGSTAQRFATRIVNVHLSPYP